MSRKNLFFWDYLWEEMDLKVINKSGLLGTHYPQPSKSKRLDPEGLTPIYVPV